MQTLRSLIAVLCNKVIYTMFVDKRTKTNRQFTVLITSGLTLCLGLKILGPTIFVASYFWPHNDLASLFAIHEFVGPTFWPLFGLKRVRGDSRILADTPEYSRILAETRETRGYAQRLGRLTDTRGYSRILCEREIHKISQN